MIDALLVIGPFLLTALFLAPYVGYLCSKRNMLAPVTERSFHKTPTPVGGGLVFSMLLTPLGLLCVYFMDLPHKEYLTALLISGLFVAYVGWKDDQQDLPAKFRLIVHLLAIAICLYFAPQTLGNIMPLWAEKILILLAWGWFINLYNFGDGLDGYSSQEALFICIFLALFFPPVAPLAMILAGTIIGFLTQNKHPAKMFMGDVGSTYLGFMLAGLMLSVATIHNAFAFLIITMLFTLDISHSVIRRSIQGHKPWVPHKDFWFHRCYNMGLGHDQVFNRALIINAVLFIFAMVSLIGYGKYYFFLSIGFLSLVALRIKYLEGSLKLNIINKKI